MSEIGVLMRPSELASRVLKRARTNGLIKSTYGSKSGPACLIGHALIILAGDVFVEDELDWRLCRAVEQMYAATLRDFAYLMVTLLTAAKPGRNKKNPLEAGFFHCKPLAVLASIQDRASEKTIMDSLTEMMAE